MPADGRLPTVPRWVRALLGAVLVFALLELIVVTVLHVNGTLRVLIVVAPTVVVFNLLNAPRRADK